MSFASESLARQYLLDTCQIYESTASAPGTLNRATMAVEYPSGETVYAGRCALEPRAADRQASDGGQTLVTERFDLDLPIGTEGVTVGCVVRPRSVRDRSLEDRAYRVVRVLAGSTELLQRFELEIDSTVPGPAGA